MAKGVGRAGMIAVYILAAAFILAGTFMPGIAIKAITAETDKPKTINFDSADNYYQDKGEPIEVLNYYAQSDDYGMDIIGIGSGINYTRDEAINYSAEILGMLSEAIEFDSEIRNETAADRILSASDSLNANSYFTYVYDSWSEKLNNSAILWDVEFILTDGRYLTALFDDTTGTLVSLGLSIRGLSTETQVKLMDESAIAENTSELAKTLAKIDKLEYVESSLDFLISEYEEAQVYEAPEQSDNDISSSYNEFDVNPVLNEMARELIFELRSGSGETVTIRVEWFFTHGTLNINLRPAL